VGDRRSGSEAGSQCDNRARPVVVAVHDLPYHFVARITLIGMVTPFTRATFGFG